MLIRISSIINPDRAYQIHVEDVYPLSENDPPIKVGRLSTGEYILYDGGRRLRAAFELGLKYIEAEIVD